MFTAMSGSKQMNHSDAEVQIECPKSDDSAGEGYAQSTESDNVVDDADGAASDSSQQRSCPICLEEIKSTTIVFRRPCHHLAHFSCVRQSLPANCPVCKRSWDDDCERELDVCVQKSGPV